MIQQLSKTSNDGITTVEVVGTDISFVFTDEFHKVVLSEDGMRMRVEDVVPEELSEEVPDPFYWVFSRRQQSRVREVGWLSVDERDLWTCSEDGELKERTDHIDI